MKNACFFQLFYIPMVGIPEEVDFERDDLTVQQVSILAHQLGGCHHSVQSLNDWLTVGS